MKALAFSMSQKPREHFEESATYKEELLSTFDKIQDGKITVPVFGSSKGHLAKVAKVTFRATDETGDSNFDHLAPDPTLLLMKSAVVASSQLGERLLPGCPPVEDWTSEDELEAQRYLAYMAERQARIPIPAEIQISQP